MKISGDNVSVLNKTTNYSPHLSALAASKVIDSTAQIPSSGVIATLRSSLLPVLSTTFLLWFAEHNLKCHWDNKLPCKTHSQKKKVPSGHQHLQTFCKNKSRERARSWNISNKFRSMPLCYQKLFRKGARFNQWSVKWLNKCLHQKLNS